jgi:hypothetical protein
MRLAGQQRGGFYPAPDEAIDVALERLVPHESGNMAIVDPCAGKGDALARIQSSLNVIHSQTYAVELDGGRASDMKATRPNWNILAPCSAFSVGCQAGAFSLAWVNPPYDDELGGGSRTEFQFLTTVSGWLKVGGVMLLVVPEHIVDPYSPALRFLSERYDDLHLTPFPYDARQYREVIVFGVKRSGLRDVKTDRYDTLPRLTTPPAWMVYHLPESSGPKRWQKTQLTDEEIGAALARSPLNRLMEPPPKRLLPRPPLPVNKGHLSLLLASGHMDGIVRPPGEPAHVIRGVATKRTYLKEVTEEETPDCATKIRRVFSEQPMLTVRAVDANGNLKTFTQDTDESKPDTDTQEEGED